MLTRFYPHSFDPKEIHRFLHDAQAKLNALCLLEQARHRDAAATSEELLRHRTALSALQQLKLQVCQLRGSSGYSNDHFPKRLGEALEELRALYLFRREGLPELQIDLEIPATSRETLLSELFTIPPVAFLRVVENLMENALHALARSAGQTPHPPRITLHAERICSQFRLCVSDNGPGLPEPLQENLFCGYTSRTGADSGMGLRIIHEVLIQAQGQLRVQTFRFKGTQFEILLPVRPET